MALSKSNNNSSEPLCPVDTLLRAIGLSKDKPSAQGIFSHKAQDLLVKLSSNSFADLVSSQVEEMDFETALNELLRLEAKYHKEGSLTFEEAFHFLQVSWRVDEYLWQQEQKGNEKTLGVGASILDGKEREVLYHKALERVAAYYAIGLNVISRRSFFDSTSASSNELLQTRSLRF